MQHARLTLGLWIRIAIAGVLAIGGIGTLLFVEFALTFIAVAIMVYMVPVMSLTLFGAGIALALLYALWVAVAAIYRRAVSSPLVVGRIAHDGMADPVEGVARKVAYPTEAVDPRGFVVLGAIGFGGFVGYVLFEMAAFLTPIRLGLVAGVVAVCYHTGVVAYSEWTNGGTVKARLEESVRVLDADESRSAGTDPEVASTADDVQSRVDRLANQAGMPSPTVRLGETRRPVAMSAGYRPDTSTIIVSNGLCERLSDRELQAVLAHELAHVSNRDAAVLTALSLPAAKADALLVGFQGEATGNEFTWTPYQHPFAVLAALPVAVLGRWAVALVARYREYVADRGAIAITGDPAALASALETLEADFDGRPTDDLREHRSTAAFSIVPPPWEEHRFFDRTRHVLRRRLFGTHPPTEKRIERLRTQI